MNNRLIPDFGKPTKFTAENYGTKISVEIDHSDLSLDEVMDAFQTLLIGMGYHENSFKKWVTERAEEYNETDAEDLKEKLEAWKFEDDDNGIEGNELENDFLDLKKKLIGLLKNKTKNKRCYHMKNGIAIEIRW